jgi:hypothetical protein
MEPGVSGSVFADGLSFGGIPELYVLFENDSRLGPSVELLPDSLVRFC